MANRDDGLGEVAQIPGLAVVALADYEHGCEDTEGARYELFFHILQRSAVTAVTERGEGRRREKLTPVNSSTQTINGSEVTYRKSDLAYSFQICANSSCEPAMVAWLRTK